MKFSELKNIALGLFFLLFTHVTIAQNFVISDPFKDHFFIENKGQYPDFQGKPVFFELTDKTDKIYILKDGFLWTKGYRDSLTDKNHVKITWIKNQFLGSNSNSRIKTIGKTNHYFTNSRIASKSYGFEKIIFENFYPKIDLVYELGQKGDGIKYSFKVHAGGNIQNIQFTYTSNDSLSLKNQETQIHIHTPLFNLTEGNLDVFKSNQRIEARYNINNQIITYNIPSFRIGQSIVIDPWVKSFNNFLRLTNLYSETFGENIGFDVDYDSKGNLYVWGGCPLGLNQLHLAKYDISGNLKWIFDGEIFIPNYGVMWYSNRVSSMGAFAVDRSTDKLYLSESIGHVQEGNIIIRLDSNGQSDSFMIHHKDFIICTKILFRCNPQRVVALGSSYLVYKWNQIFELKDTNIYKPKGFLPVVSTGVHWMMVLDAVTDDSNRVFVLYKKIANGSALTSTNNFDAIAKLTDSMNGTLWIDTVKTKLKTTNLKPFVPTTFTPANTVLGFSTNSISVTKNYLYYYDGKFLGAYNKYNGKLIHLDSIPNKNQSFQQGIVADNCGNVIIGADSGRIKIYKFNGSAFQYIKKVVVYANSPRCILDLTYDKDRNVLVFSGDSMAGVISNPVSCEVSKTTEFYVYPNKRCSNFAFAQVKYPDTTKSYTFIWYDSTTNKIARKITKYKQFRDTLSNRDPSHSYLVTIKKEDGCYTTVSSFWLFAIPQYDTSFKITLCEGNSYKHNNKYYIGDTTIIDTLTTYFGCDSLIRYQIKTNKHTSISQDKFLCRGDTLWVGQYFHTQTGNFHDTFINANGCDSVVHTKLKVFHDSIVQFKRICNGNSFSIGKHTYTKTGVYLDTFKNYWGCDSIVTTKLIISYDTLIKQSFSICRGKTIKVGLNVYDRSGIFTDSFKRLSGCDSVIITNLIVNNDTTISNNITICQGDTISIGKHKYFLSDHYQDTLNRITGCDSVIITHLKVLNTHNTENSYLLCNRDSILIDGKYYNKSTTFKKTYKNSNGCDSTVTYTLKKNSVIANFEIDSTQNPIFVFRDLSQGNTKFYWSFGDFTVDSMNNNTSHQYKNDQTYWATVCLKIVDSFGCNDTICRRIQISKLLYYLYNSFTPGNDGKNDVLKIGYVGGNFQYNLFVYNRWGALVFETQNANVSDESKFWNGKDMNNGADCPEGSYFALYQLYLNGPNNPPKQINGVITLIR